MVRKKGNWRASGLGLGIWIGFKRTSLTCCYPLGKSNLSKHDTAKFIFVLVIFLKHLDWVETYLPELLLSIGEKKPLTNTGFRGEMRGRNT
jgi:hypothetical protein